MPKMFKNHGNRAIGLRLHEFYRSGYPVSFRKTPQLIGNTRMKLKEKARGIRGGVKKMWCIDRFDLHRRSQVGA